jgi:hypothetical protein
MEHRMRHASRINHLEKQIESVRVAAAKLIVLRKIFHPDNLQPYHREKFFELQKRCTVTDDGIWDVSKLTQEERLTLKDCFGLGSPYGPHPLDRHKRRR